MRLSGSVLQPAAQGRSGATTPQHPSSVQTELTAPPSVGAGEGTRGTAGRVNCSGGRDEFFIKLEPSVNYSSSSTHREKSLAQPMGARPASLYPLGTHPSRRDCPYFRGPSVLPYLFLSWQHTRLGVATVAIHQGSVLDLYTPAGDSDLEDTSGMASYSCNCRHSYTHVRSHTYTYMHSPLHSHSHILSQYRLLNTQYSYISHPPHIHRTHIYTCSYT